MMRLALLSMQVLCNSTLSCLWDAVVGLRPGCGRVQGTPSSPAASSTPFSAGGTTPTSGGILASSSTDISTASLGEGLERVQGNRGFLVTGPSLQASFKEVELGVLVRASPKGRIFRATWHESQVAVKVGGAAPCVLLESDSCVAI